MTDNTGSTRIEQASQFDFDSSIERLTAAIENAGMRVFARIDHAANAREVGMSMPDTVVLFYGKAAGGTPVMLAAPSSALDLPLRLLVRVDTDGRTLVSYDPIAAVLRPFDVPAALVARLEAAQRLVLEAIE